MGEREIVQVGVDIRDRGDHDGYHGGRCWTPIGRGMGGLVFASTLRSPRVMEISVHIWVLLINSTHRL